MFENLADVTDNMDVHIEAVIAHLNEKFPQAGPERVREIVHQVFAELEAEAAVLIICPPPPSTGLRSALSPKWVTSRPGQPVPRLRPPAHFRRRRQTLRRIADGEPGALIGHQALT